MSSGRQMPISNESKEISRVLKSEKVPVLRITESEKTLYPCILCTKLDGIELSNSTPFEADTMF